HGRRAVARLADEGAAAQVQRDRAVDGGHQGRERQVAGRGAADLQGGGGDLRDFRAGQVQGAGRRGQPSVDEPARRQGLERHPAGGGGDRVVDGHVVGGEGEIACGGLHAAYPVDNADGRRWSIGGWGVAGRGGGRDGRGGIGSGVEGDTRAGLDRDLAHAEGAGVRLADAAAGSDYQVRHTRGDRLGDLDIAGVDRVADDERFSGHLA